MQTKNRVHRLLERAWITPPNVTDLFGQRAWLKTIDLSSAQRVVMQTLVDELSHIETLQARIQSEIANRIKDDPDVKLLITIDGSKLRHEPKRPRQRRHATPRTHDQTGVVRKVVVQGTHQYPRHNPRAKAKTDSIAAKQSKGRARPAAGSDLLNIA